MYCGSQKSPFDVYHLLNIFVKTVLASSLPVLEPDLDLSLGQAERVRDLYSSPPGKVSEHND